MRDQQKQNTIKAYQKHDLNYDALGDIVNACTNKHTPLHHTFSLPVTEEFILNSVNDCSKLVNLYPDFAFSFVSRHVTERATGKCTPLKKFLRNSEQLTDDQIDSFLTILDSLQGNTMLITTDPWFLIGSSVTADDRQLDLSCHYPGSNRREYQSGPISYALDSDTLVFLHWENGIVGRQLVHLAPDHNYLVTGRLYGTFTESHSSACRKELYKLLNIPPLKKAKVDPSISRNGFQGYLDTEHYTVYRDCPSTNYTIELCPPMCPDCGKTHSNDALHCVNCDMSVLRCEMCGDRVDEYSSYYGGNQLLCEYCYCNNYFCCECCEETTDLDERVTVHTHHNHTESWCSWCAEKKYYKCDDCGEYFECLSETVDGTCYCENCLSADYEPCYECNRYENVNYLTDTVGGNHYCTVCAKTLNQCDVCSEHTIERLTETVWGTWLCDNCIGEHAAETCPVCGKAQDYGHACSYTCAVDNLFEGGNSRYA